MKLKKLKRLLSLTLSAVMVTSMVSVPVNAETVSDNPGTVQEETIDDGEDADRKDAEGEEGVSGAEEEGQDGKDNAHETVEEQTPSNEDTEEKTEEPQEEEVKGAKTADTGAKAARTTDTQAEGDTPADTETGGDETAGGAGDETTGGGEDSGGDAEEIKAIVVGDAAGQTPTLDAAVDAAAAGEIKTIQLEKDVTLTKNLDNVTIDTKGHLITIPAGTNVEFGSKTTIKNEVLRESGNTMQKNHAMLLAQGNLTVKGGVYETKGVQLLKVTGESSTTVENGTFACTATKDEVANLNSYDEATLIDVEGTGAKLTMTGGTVNADVGNGTDCGMYGIFIWNGGEVKLGQSGQEGPAVNSMFAAIGMNGIKSPGRITVESGTYKSSVSCTGAAITKFNSVLYLPASATVNISGGTFEATATGNNDIHVISIPYDVVDGSAVRLNLNITGGTFIKKGSGTTINHPNRSTGNCKARVTVSGGEFSTDISADTELGNGSIPEGLSCYEVDGGLYRVAAPAIVSVGTKTFSSLQDAIDATATLGINTITLKQDITLEGSYNLNGKTIETKGFKITVPKDKSLAFSGGTVKNDQFAVTKDKGQSWEKSCGIFEVLGELHITSGTYETKGIQMIRVNGGAAEIGGNARLSCTATTDEIKNSDQSYYDGTPLVTVTEKGVLTIKDAELNANVGNGTDSGMYGVYVYHDGALILGEGETVPTIDSMFSPIGMNGTTSPGTITINGGSYTSHVACEAESIKNFNAVLYLPANADVTINDGTFTAAGTKGEQHVFSIPYSRTLNLIINGGTFQTTNKAAADSVLFDAGMQAEGNQINVNVRGGSFSADPSDYVAGCSNVKKNDAGMWVIEGTADHELKWVAKKDSTCWEEGVIGHYECQGCQKMYSASTPADDKLLTEEQVVIARKEHIGELVPAKTTTKPCTESSNSEYYKCPNCGKCYEKLEDVDQDEDGTMGKEESEIVTAPTGHNYKITGEQGEEYAVTIDTKGFNPAQFKYGEANGVKAALTCQNEKCGAPIEADEVSVTVDNLESLKGDCSTDRNLTLKVKATFKKDKFGKPTTDKTQFIEVSKEAECKIPAGYHSFEEGSVTFDWDEFDISAFQAGKDNKVTATGICASCGNTITATKVAVTSADYPAAGTPSCEAMYHFTADAVFGEDKGTGEDAQSAPHVSVEKEFSGKHNLVEGDTYLPADCMHKGHWATYVCTVCKNEYLGEDSAKENKPVLPAEKEIAKRPHTINAPTFSWMTNDQGEELETAQAVFRCTACDNTITISEGVEATLPKAEADKIKCGQIVTVTYDVKVKFDKTGVGENAAGDALTYQPDPAKEQLYSGNLTQTKEMPHMLEGLEEENLEVAWADAAEGDTAETKHDVAKGVKVSATCGREGCGKKLTVLSVKNQIVDKESDILDDDPFIAPTVSLALNTEDSRYQAATCKADGNDVYDVTVKYRDEAGAVKTIGTTSIVTKTDKDENAHDWSEPDWTWKPVKDSSGALVLVEVNAKDPDGKAITCKVPQYEATAVYHCKQNCGAQEKTVKQEVGVPAAADAKEHIEFEITHTAGSCVKSSRTEYRARVYEGDRPVGEALSDPEVYIKESNGHQLTVKWEWEDDAEANDGNATRYTKVTATRYCKECSYVKDAPDQYGEKITSVTIPETVPEEGTSIAGTNVVLTVEKDGTGANCTAPGTTKYTATLKEGTLAAPGDVIAEDKKELATDALGHDIRWFVTWTEKAGQTGANKYEVTRTKKCQRNNCDHVEAGSGATEKLELLYVSKDATCSAAGNKTWTIKNAELSDGSKYFDSQLNESGTLSEEFMKKTETAPIDSNAHDYGTAVVTWEEDAAESGADSITVTLTRTCSYAEGNEDHIPAETKTYTAVKQPVDKVVDCANGYGWTYQVSDTDKEEVADWEMPENWEEGSYTYSVPAAEGAANHDLRFVRGTTSNSCTEKVIPKHYACDRCGKYFKDINCSAEYTAEEVKGKVQGHLYGEPVFSWKAGEEGTAAQAVFECVRSGCEAGAVGHKKTITEIEVDTNVTAKGFEPQCEKSSRVESIDGRRFANGEGCSWVQAKLTLTETQIGIDTYLGGETYQDMLYQVIPAVEHRFEGEDGKCLWCDTKGGITISFHGRDSKTVIGKTYLSPSSLPTDSASVELATATNQIGYKFEGWTMTENGTVVSANIKDEILNAAKVEGTTAIDVYAIYKEVETTPGNIEVQYLYNGGALKNPITVERAIGYGYTAQADAEMTTEGGAKVVFSHWEKNGVKVGTEERYSINVVTNSKITLKAIYVAAGEKTESRPIIEVTDTYASEVSGVNKVSFALTMSIPETYTLKEVGNLFVKAPAVDMVEKNMTLDTIGTTVDGVELAHKKSVFATTGSFTKIHTLKVAGLEDQKMFVRPYVIVTDKDGNEETYYGSMQVAVFNQLNAQ